MWERSWESMFFFCSTVLRPIKKILPINFIKASRSLNSDPGMDFWCNPWDRILRVELRIQPATKLGPRTRWTHRQAPKGLGSMARFAVFASLTGNLGKSLGNDAPNFIANFHEVLLRGLLDEPKNYIFNVARFCSNSHESY